MLRPWAFAIALHGALLRQGFAEDSVSAKWQNYEEDDGRIRVISRYLGVEKALTQSLTLRAHGVHDAISGATPVGSPTEDGSGVELSELTDIRTAGVVDLDWIHGTRKTTFQYSHSKESDFLSRGYAVTQLSEFNQRNTGLSYGLSFIDDDVRPRFFDVARTKESVDGFVGLSQVVDPNTIVSLNFTYSRYDGYLSDPYKLIRQSTEVLPGLFLPLTFPENRPSERTRRIWFANAKRYFPQLKGSLDVDYRYFSDTWGIDSNTLDIEWYQKIGDKLTVRPKYRVYRQGAADFYRLSLDGADFEAPSEPGPAGPFYSADYRLAKLQTETYGLKVVWKWDEAWAFDAAFERYEMKGLDRQTPDAAFPDASVTTVGATLWY